MKILKREIVFINDVLLSLVMIVFGLIPFVFPEVILDKPITYSYITFYLIAFFSFIGYFLTRSKRKGYESLFLSFICVCTATLLFVLEKFSVFSVLGTAFLVFSVLYAINRIFHINKEPKEAETVKQLRAIALILLIFVSILTVQNFYRQISDVQIIMIGFFFMSYGFIVLIETLLLKFVKIEVLKKIVEGEQNNSPKLKKVRKFNENVEALDEIIKTIEPSKKRKAKKKKVKQNAH